MTSNTDFKIVIADPVRSIHCTTYDAANYTTLTRRILFAYDESAKLKHYCDDVDENYFKFPTTRIPASIKFVSKYVKCPDDDSTKPLPHIYGEISEDLWKKIQDKMKPDLVLINGKIHNSLNSRELNHVCRTYIKSELGYAPVEFHEGSTNNRLNCGRWYNFSTVKLDEVDNGETNKILSSWNNRMPNNMYLVLTSNVYNCNTCKCGDIHVENNMLRMDMVQQIELCNNENHCHEWNLSLAVCDKDRY